MISNIEQDPKWAIYECTHECIPHSLLRCDKMQMQIKCKKYNKYMLICMHFWTVCPVLLYIYLQFLTSILPLIFIIFLFLLGLMDPNETLQVPKVRCHPTFKSNAKESLEDFDSFWRTKRPKFMEQLRKERSNLNFSWFHGNVIFWYER